MSGYLNFLKRMNAGGKTMREEQIENACHLIQSTFADDPSYVVEGCPIWYSDRIIHPRIYDYKWKSTLPFQATIQTQIDEPFYLGDIIPWGKNNGYWLCVGFKNLHGINWEGTLQYCNFYLKFLSPLNGEQREYPISMYNATQYGTGEENRRMIDIGSAAHIVFLPCDEHTLLIDNGFRFLLDRNKKLPTAYRVTQMDTTSYADGQNNGYLRLYVLEDQFNEKTDDKENLIANAWEDKIGSGTELKETDDKWL